MLKNLIKHSISSFRKQWSYVIIKVLGLSIGLAGSLLIALYVINEASYDKFNVNKDRIYRLVLKAKSGDQEIHTSYSCAPIGPAMSREFPEIEDFLRMHGLGPTVVKYKDQILTDENIIAVDSSFFNFFSIPLIMGDPDKVLNSPGKAVITESMAKKIFGNEDPVNKFISLGEDTSRYIISGIMSDTPKTSHFDAHILVSFISFSAANSTVWLNNNYSTYLLLRSNTKYITVADKVPALLEKYVSPELKQAMGISIQDFLNQGNIYNFSLQKLTDIHIDPSIQQEFKPAVDPKYLYIFISISILVILIAAINFMNLATAQASRRAKEVGIKKVGGCSRRTLIYQFMAESILVSFIALLLSVILIWITLPYFNNLLGTQLELNLLVQWYTVPGLLAFTIIVGILSGSYPAFYLSSFSPVDVLKGSVKGSTQNVLLRRILVVFQFAVSILLITGTIVMYRQIYYMLNKDMGFNKEQMLVINRAQSLESRVEPFKDAVKKIPGVINIASSTAVPFNNTSTGDLYRWF
jgi:putative ABC transport system permease protein